MKRRYSDVVPLHACIFSCQYHINKLMPQRYSPVSSLCIYLSMPRKTPTLHCKACGKKFGRIQPCTDICADQNTCQYYKVIYKVIGSIEKAQRRNSLTWSSLLIKQQIYLVPWSIWARDCNCRKLIKKSMSWSRVWWILLHGLKSFKAKVNHNTPLELPYMKKPNRT